MERKFPKIVVYFGCVLFRKIFGKVLFHSIVELSENSNQNFQRMEIAFRRGRLAGQILTCNADREQQNCMGISNYKDLILGRRSSFHTGDDLHRVQSNAVSLEETSRSNYKMQSHFRPPVLHVSKSFEGQSITQ